MVEMTFISEMKDNEAKKLCRALEGVKRPSHEEKRSRMSFRGNKKDKPRVKKKQDVLYRESQGKFTRKKEGYP